MNAPLNRISGLSKLLLIGLGKRAKERKQKGVAIVLCTVACILGSALPLPLISSLGSSTAIAQTKAQTTDVHEANRLLNLGIQQFQAEQLEAALQSTQQALKLYQELGYRQGIAQALGNIGMIYMFLGHASPAIDHLQQSLNLARELEDRQTEMNALGNLGYLYLVQQDYSRAISSFQQVLEIAEALNNQPVATQTQQLLQQAQEGQKITTAMEEFFQDLVNQDPVNVATWFLPLLQYGLQHPANSQDAEMNNLMVTGIQLLGERQYPEAIEVFKQYQAILEQINETNPVLHLPLLNLAQAYWLNGELKQAETTLRELMEIWEAWGGWHQSGLQTDKSNISGLNIVRQTMVYEMLQSVLVQQNQPEAALDISERGRTQATINLLSQRLLPLLD